jgi:hypothetical protein
MKKNFFFLLALIFLPVIVSFAQAEGKKFLISSSVNFGRKTQVSPSEIKTQYLRFSPAAGYMVSESLMLGIGYKYMHDKNETTRINEFPLGFPRFMFSESVLTTHAPFIFGKYYFPLGTRLKGAIDLTAMAGGTYLEYKSGPVNNTGSSSSYVMTEKYNHYSITLSPELQLMLTPFVGLKTGYNLLSFSRDDKSISSDKDKNKNFEFSLNPASLLWGVVFCF